jgi:hypothetical protein
LTQESYKRIISCVRLLRIHVFHLDTFCMSYIDGWSNQTTFLVNYPEITHSSVHDWPTSKPTWFLNQRRYTNDSQCMNMFVKEKYFLCHGSIKPAAHGLQIICFPFCDKGADYVLQIVLPETFHFYQHSKCSYIVFISFYIYIYTCIIKIRQYCNLLYNL